MRLKGCVLAKIWLKLVYFDEVTDQKGVQVGGKPGEIRGKREEIVR